jgi:ribonucleoside-triphosphate reductase
MAKCGKKCEVFSRVVGYHRPVQNWNLGKREEFNDRVAFKEKVSMGSKFATSGRPTLLAEKLTGYQEK